MSDRKTREYRKRITKVNAKEFLEGATLPDAEQKPVKCLDVVVHSLGRPDWAKPEAGIYSFHVEYRTKKGEDRVAVDIPLKRDEHGNVKVVLLH